MDMKKISAACATAAALAALCVPGSAFAAETIRTGVNAVGVGQVESSRIDHIRRVLGVVFFGFAGIIA